MMISCKDVAHLVSASRDEDLSVTNKLQVRLHLLICRGCRRFDRQMHTLRLAMRQLGREPGRNSTAELPDEVRERIRQHLRAARRSSIK